MPDPSSTPVVYRFGLYEANERTGELRKDGRRLKLRGRPFDILVCLLRRGGDVVTRDELRQQLWPADTFVDFDHGLNSAMNRLRDGLRDSAENPRFIETLPRRGYRFIAPISIAQTASAAIAPADSAPSVVERAAAPVTAGTPPTAVEVAPLVPARIVVSRPSWVVLGLGVGALAVAVVVALLYFRVTGNSRASSKMTLAVLPFEIVNADAEQDFFSAGFTDEMIAELGKLDPEHLGVIARTTTRLDKDAKKTVGEIRKELGVDYVLEGSVRRAGARVRITAQLVDAATMTNLWAERYDRDVSDVLAIQSEVAMKIAQSLALALNRPQAQVAQQTSFPSYELCLRAKFFRAQATEDGTRKAVDYFQRAIATDPTYAPAHSGLADCYRLLGAPGWEVEQPADLLRKAKAGAERALALDPQSSESHAVLSMVKLDYDWDRQGSEREVLEAIRLNPSSVQAHQYYSATLTTMGRFEDAIREAQRAKELDPLSAISGTTLAIRYWYAGRIDEAAAEFQKTLETSPEFAVAHWGLAQCYRAKGEARREIEELQRAVVLSGNSAYMRAHLAFGYATSGDRARAESVQQELEAEARGRYASPYHAALISVGVGNRSAMLEALERAFVDRSGWMVFLPGRTGIRGRAADAGVPAPARTRQAAQLTSGQNTLIKHHLAGGASRLAALRLPANTPGIATPPCINRTVGAPALVRRATDRGPQRGSRAGVVVRAPRSAIWSLFSVSRPLMATIATQTSPCVRIVTSGPQT
jgi:TolB-like protein/DNA-binding winged helix-turn-helix (wHTH) protein/Tfp pilus assembly protein PilF